MIFYEVDNQRVKGYEIRVSRIPGKTCTPRSLWLSVSGVPDPHCGTTGAERLDWGVVRSKESPGFYASYLHKAKQTSGLSVGHET